MHPKELLQAAATAVFAMLFMCANTAIAVECLPPACVASEAADEGVPDGIFESNAAVQAAPPADPPAPSSEAADDPGAAIFNPFAGAQDRQKRPLPSFLSLLVNGDYAAALAIVVTLTLVLAGVAAFIVFFRREHS